MRIKKVSETTPTMASIVDGYSTSTQDGYSCNYVNDRIETEYSSTNNKTYSCSYINNAFEHLSIYTIYNSTTGGSNTTIQLSSSAGDFDYIEILYRSNDGSGYKNSSGRIASPNGSIVSLAYHHAVSNVIYVKQAEVNINGNQISFLTNHEWNFSNGQAPNVNNTANIYIYRVLGYKA